MFNGFISFYFLFFYFLFFFYFLIFFFFFFLKKNIGVFSYCLLTDFGAIQFGCHIKKDDGNFTLTSRKYPELSVEDIRCESK